jgi:hypothetical protein
LFLLVNGDCGACRGRFIFCQDFGVVASRAGGLPSFLVASQPSPVCTAFDLPL